MNDLSKRIAECRIRLGLNQSELARLLSVTPQAVQRWESGGAPRGTRLAKIASALNTTAEYLLFGSITFTRKASSDANTESAPAIRGLVPLISWVQAGAWSEIVDNFAPHQADDWYQTPRNTSPSTFALRVRGVSMEPKFQDGDIIFVDPDAPANHNSFVVVRLDTDQEATFKQLVLEGERKFLRALNPDWPGEKLISINGNATICGVVVGKWVSV